MSKLRNFVKSLHKSTSRDYIARMRDEKSTCMSIAKRYDCDYWDGERRFGYGGYRYIPGRWKPVAQALINEYHLKAGSKVLDVGCGKGFLLHEMKLIEPDLELVGIDISQYALDCADASISSDLFIHKAQEPYPFADKEFDLVMSLGTLHNLRLPELKIALSEVERVGKNGYVMLESYRNNQELFNLQCWALTCESFFDVDEWIWVYDHFGYTGDYEFIFFE
jgi:SAM-dependent methyltransferase